MEHLALTVWTEELMQQVVAVPNAHALLVRVEAWVLLNTRAVEAAAAAPLSTGVVWVAAGAVLSIGVLWGVVVGDKQQ